MVLTEGLKPSTHGAYNHRLCQIGLRQHGAGSWIRTNTLQGLNLLPLPLGYTSNFKKMVGLERIELSRTG